MKWLVWFVVGLLIIGGLGTYLIRWWSSPAGISERDRDSERLREEARVRIGRRQSDLSAQEARLQAKIRETEERAKALDAQLKALNADLAKQQQDRERVIRETTADQVVELARALGYHPQVVKPCP